VAQPAEGSERGVTLSIVIPVFNEGDHLARVTEALQAVLEPLALAYEVVFVDDGSRDESWPRITALAKQYGFLRGLKLSRNFGKEAALAAGLEAARGQAVVVMDGDLQHPPELIPQMVQLWRDEGVAVVEAVKQDRGRESLLNKLAAGVFYKLTALLPGPDLRGATDFRLMDAKVVAAWRRLGERSLFFRGMSAWLGFERRELPFSVPERVGGQSRWNPIQLLRLALTGITSFTSVPLHLTTLIGLVFFVFSILLGGHTLYMKLSGQAVSGFATVILLVLITGSCILMSLGVLGIYIARIYEEVKARPRYLVTQRTEDES
jgi:dolichol-phosphate mannosyltransferase